jgi:hypothetical protein
MNGTSNFIREALESSFALLPREDYIKKEAFYDQDRGLQQTLNLLC